MEIGKLLIELRDYNYIVHRNINPSNIVVTSDNIYKVVVDIGNGYNSKLYNEDTS